MEIFNEFTVLFASHLHCTFFFETDTSMTEKLHNFKSYIGWVVLANLSFNIIANLGVVVWSSLIGLKDFSVNCHKSFMDWKRSRKHQEARTIIFREFDLIKEFPDLQRQIDEEIAIQYCKDYHKHRIWMHANGIDFSDLPEEKIFQDYNMMYQFKKRKAQIESEIKLRREIYE